MRLLPVLLACLLALPVHGKVNDPGPEQSYALRKRTAFALANDNAPVAEEQLLRLLKENQSDHEVMFRLGRLILERASLLEPGAKKRKLLKEARRYLVRAKEAGSTEPLIATVLAAINADGSENRAPPSKNAGFDQALQAAEQAFGQKKFAKAIEHYQRALEQEPGHYIATLHLGDAYFADNKLGEAIAWFEKAAAIEPNRETAYRYHGDALSRLGRRDDALDQYLQAIIAEPYNAYTWRALHHGCQAFLLKPWVHAEKLPVAEVRPGKEGKAETEIRLPEKFTALHVIYATARGKWQTENPPARSSKPHPYRQTIEEEVAALRTLLTVVAELKSSQQPPPPELADLLKGMEATIDQLKEINDAGLLEAHVFLFRANQDIVADYANYRDRNRDKIHEYLLRFYLHLR